MNEIDITLIDTNDTFIQLGVVIYKDGINELNRVRGLMVNGGTIEQQQYEQYLLKKLNKLKGQIIVLLKFSEGKL